MRRRSQLLYWILMLWSNHFDYSQWSCGNSFPFLRRRKNRDLLQLGQQHQGRRRLKNKYIFFVGISRMTGCVYLLLQRRKLTSAKRMRAALSSKWKLKSFAVGVSFLGPRKFWWYHVVILQRTAKGLFTRHDFVACDKLTTGLRHDLRVVSEL